MGLSGHHPGPEPAEELDPRADVRSDVETEIVGLNPLAIKILEPSSAFS